MALAIRFEERLRGGTFHDYAELARLGRVTRARMTQIMKLREFAVKVRSAAFRGYIEWEYRSFDPRQRTAGIYTKE